MIRISFQLFTFAVFSFLFLQYKLISLIFWFKFSHDLSQLEMATIYACVIFIESLYVEYIFKQERLTLRIEIDRLIIEKISSQRYILSSFESNHKIENDDKCVICFSTPEELKLALMNTNNHKCKGKIIICEKCLSNDDIPPIECVYRCTEYQNRVILKEYKF